MEAIRWVRAGIKLLISIIFLGILMMWIIYPTNTWSLQWKVAISKATNSTYFGKQGTNMLVWTFPMLFIAVLGCLYLHLGNKVLKCNSSESRNRKNGFPAGIWKRPVLTRGPLGIVSGVELAFFLMFIALLVWSFSTFLHRSFVKITPKAASKEGEEVWEMKLERASLYLGLIGNTCLAFLFFPVARGSSVLPVLGLTSEASIKYHIWLGHIMMIIFTAHGIGYISYWASTDQISEMRQWAKTGVSNVAGVLSLMAGLALWATTFPRIRRRMFELFFYTHYMYIPFIFFFILHVGISFAFMMLPGFYLFILDRYLRFLQSRPSVRLLSARVLPHDSDTLELNFSKAPGWDYNPTSILFINIPSISKLQWHPFTISSSSKLDPQTLSVVIKREGTWTTKLYQMLSSPSPVDHLSHVSVEGPYGPGPAGTDFLKHDMVVMVSGGSGITPFISIIRELIFLTGTSDQPNNNLPQLLLICAFKKSSELAMLDLILPPNSATPSTLPSTLHLQIKAYVTREEHPPPPTTATYSKPISTVWFKQQQTDVPVSPILGPKGWLWLGAIISSSFVAFLILIGIITRYYIYPIDHNKNIYGNAGKSVLNMLVLCVCIAGTASGAVLWNKKKYAAGASANQVLNMEGMSPTGSPAADHHESRRDVVERELESHPQESLVGVTQVYFGERPNLMKMLLELKGKSSIGVMVCGPKKMREEAARICSSGLADNLHYESISFSW